MTILACICFAGNDPPMFTKAPAVIQIAVGDQVQEPIQVCYFNCKKIT